MKYIFAALFLIAGTVSAHSGGLSLEKPQNGYFVDIGFNSSLVETKKEVRADFKLFRQDKPNEEAEFTDVGVELKQNGSVIYRSTISRAVAGETFLVYKFEQAGDYNMFVRFNRGEEALVESEFTFNVVGSTKQPNKVLIAAALLGILVVLGAVLVYRKKRQSPLT